MIVRGPWLLPGAAGSAGTGTPVARVAAGVPSCGAAHAAACGWPPGRRSGVDQVEAIVREQCADLLAAGRLQVVDVRRGDDGIPVAEGADRVRWDALRAAVQPRT